MTGCFINSICLGGDGVVNIVDICVANSHVLTILGVWILEVVVVVVVCLSLIKRLEEINPLTDGVLLR